MRKQALLLLLIFVVSCAPQTNTPFTTQTAFPTVTNLPTTEPDASSFRLRKWSEEEYQRIRESNYVGTLLEHRAMIQEERLLNFPNSAKDLIWDIWFNKRVGNIGVRPQQDLVDVYLSTRLNDGASLEEIITELESHYIEVFNNLTVSNQFGDERIAQVFLIRLPDSDWSTAVYAIIEGRGKPEVVKIRDWEFGAAPALWREFQLYDVGDTNENKISELVVQIDTAGSGMPPIAKSTIEHVEWSIDNGRFSITDFPIFWQDCDQGPCEGKWEFSQENAKKLLRTQSYWITLEGCPDLTLQSTYQWDGEKYNLITEEEPIKLENGISSECVFAWAESSMRREDGWKDDFVIATAEKSLQTWDSDNSAKYGPAGKDYAKLILGILHDLRNEDQQALTLLSSLAKSPSLPEYDFMSRLAGIYLEARNAQGKSEACNAIDTAYQNEFMDKIPDPNYLFPNDQAALQLWGIIEPRNFLCASSKMFSSEISDSKISSFAALDDWLRTKNIIVNQSVTVDLNNDEKEDVYLALLEWEDEDGLELWSFSNASGKVEGELLYGYEEKAPVDMSRLPFVSGDGSVYYLLNVSDELGVITISQNGDVEIFFENYNVQSYKTGTDFLVITAREYYGCDVYYEERWDLETGETTQLLNPFEAVQLEIERKLFNDKDYSGTIDFIDAFLQSAPPEPKQVSSSGADGCTFYPPFFIPYYRYLRGLAYEQLGEDTQAVKAYYEIWKDYPDNFFGIISKLKLEPITP